MVNKKIVKKTLKGFYYVEIPEDIIRASRLREGDTVEFLLGSIGEVKRKDLILRKIT